MATSVDMALDDIISKNRLKGRGRGRARRGQGPRRPFSGGRMPGAVRRGPLSVNSRPSLNAISKTSRRIGSLPWQHDLLEDSIRAAGVTGIEVGTKLYISNLDYGVSNEDIRELFSEVGELKRYAVHYDKNGRSSGSAEVVYTRRSDAFAALKKYNNVLLDGKPMRIEILGAMEMAISAQMNVTGVNGRQKRTAVMMPGAGRVRGPIAANRGSGLSHRGGLSNGGARGRAPGRGRGRAPGRGRGRAPGRGRGHAAGRGRGRGRGKKQPIEKSADELDKDLENYHAEAMQS